MSLSPLPKKGSFSNLITFFSKYKRTTSSKITKSSTPKISETTHDHSLAAESESDKMIRELKEENEKLKRMLEGKGGNMQQGNGGQNAEEEEAFRQREEELKKREQELLEKEQAQEQRLKELEEELKKKEQEL